MTKMLESLHFAKGIDPVADAFDNATSPASDIYSLRNHGRILFVVYVGVGATGISTWLVEACDDVTPTTAVAIPFWYREVITGDTEGAITRATVAGFTNTLGSSKLILIEADAKDIDAVAAAQGFGFIRLRASAEPTNSPVLASIMAILDGSPARYSRQINATVIV